MCCGSASTLTRIRIHLFNLMPIRVRPVNLMRILIESCSHQSGANLRHCQTGPPRLHRERSRPSMAPFWTWIRIRLLTLKRIFGSSFLLWCAVLRIRIPRKRIKVFLTQKIVYKLSEIWSRMFIPDQDLDFLPMPNPGSSGQKDTGSRIRIRYTGDADPDQASLNDADLDRIRKKLRRGEGELARR